MSHPGGPFLVNAGLEPSHVSDQPGMEPGPVAHCRSQVELLRSAARVCDDLDQRPRHGSRLSDHRCASPNPPVALSDQRLVLALQRPVPCGPKQPFHRQDSAPQLGLGTWLQPCGFRPSQYRIPFGFRCFPEPLAALDWRHHHFLTTRNPCQEKNPKFLGVSIHPVSQTIATKRKSEAKNFSETQPSRPARSTPG